MYDFANFTVKFFTELSVINYNIQKLYLVGSGNIIMIIDNSNIIYINQMNIVSQSFHWHDEMELLIVIDGSIELKLGYEQLVLHAGDIMLVSSDESHSITNLGDSANVIHVYIDCNTCYERFPDFYEIVAISTYEESFKQLNHNKSIIIKNVNELAIALNNQSDKNTILDHFDALIRSIIICYRRPAASPDDVLASAADDEKMAVIYRIIRYMYSNYDHKVNLQEISEAEYMNLYHLSHSFKEITGYSFRDWLNYVRAEHAEKLLLETNLTLSEIASKCGFSDIRYLNKHFQKWYKTTPNKYRNIFRPSYELVNSIREYQGDTSLDSVIVNLTALAPAVTEAEHTTESIVLDLNDDNVSEALDRSWQDGIICNITWLMEKRNLERLLSIRSDLGVSGVIVDDLFTVGLHYIESTMPDQLYDVITFLLDKFSRVSIRVNYSSNYIYEVEGATSFINDFPLFDTKAKLNNLEFSIYDEKGDSPHDESCLNTFLKLAELHNIPVSFQNGKEISLSMNSTSYINRMTTGELNIEWLFTRNGFKNNIYYFHKFLASMFTDIVINIDNYMVSRSGSSFRILMFSDKTSKSSAISNYQIKLDHINCDYKYVTYSWDINDDDTMNLISDPRVIRHLTNSEYETLDMLSLPWASFDYISADDCPERCFTIETDLAPSCLKFIEIIAL